MPAWLFHGWAEGAIAAAKAVGMYVVALVGLRLAPRRTLSQWTAIDVAAAVALGAIIGRTAIAQDQSLTVGAAALVAILVANYVLAVGRFHSRIARLVDHRVKVLVDHGRLRPDQLRRCGLIEEEVLANLRRNGVGSLAEVRYVLYETKGELTIVPERGADTPDPELVRIALGATPPPPAEPTGAAPRTADPRADGRTRRAGQVSGERQREDARHGEPAGRPPTAARPSGVPCSAERREAWSACRDRRRPWRSHCPRLPSSPRV